MIYQVKKPLQRAYELLNLLIEADQPLSKKEISTIIMCSRPTLDRAIVETNQLIQTYSMIEVDVAGVRLSEMHHLDKEQVKALVSRETFIMQFLCDILLGKIAKIEDWAKMKYYSSSVVYRNIRQVSQYLEEKNIILDNKDGIWRLEGEKWNIRYFYFELLKDHAVISDEWFFEKFDRLAILDFVRRVNLEFEIYLPPVVEYFYCLFIAIHLSVISSVNISDDWYYDNEKPVIIDKERLNQAFAILEKRLGISLKKKDRLMLLQMLNFFPISYITDKSAKRRIRYAKEYSTEMYYLGNLAYHIFQGNEEELFRFTDYLDVFMPLQLLGTYPEIEYSEVKNKLINNQELISPMFLEKIALLEASLKDKNYAAYYFDNKEVLFKKLYVLYKVYEQKNIKQELIVTFMSQHGAIQEEYYQNKVALALNIDKVNYIPIYDIQKNQLWDQVDLVITDYVLTEISQTVSVYYVDEKCLNSDIKKIASLLRKFAIKKKHSSRKKG
ncbi:helix-turn-helix domain-containing protein [Vagococcus intermedius]|uniref:Helix-turn-helix domain-containing protein n=1 Tax=Vagococcus intermedius TaxID=2991418 RepID=A0AAF0I8J5_9ENTE|nr:helix-turn-helix domain-containing protein [Vagococcus intermedius]WEG72602.1 helix-turn-helix domain-containing protein [Vagococcus intermedius]WEG74687.1 helix-turn-helix domain-containing protein [Vagococcus intermedius]